MAQSLSNNIMPTGEEHNKDLTSFMQYDCDSYNDYSYYGNNKNAMDIAWEKFWAKNGEQLIWASWIEKYADYINPDYFQNNARVVEDEKSQDAEINEVAIEKYFEQNTCFPNQAHKNCEILHSNFAGIFNKSNSSDGEFKLAAISSSNTSFSFEQTGRQEVNDKDADENRKKITNFEISPEDRDGWNPLSPFSIEENYNQQSNAEDERLLTRCDSINGSIAKTNATSDSMTNVTKMTLTSSSCDSNSVHSSSLITSVTSSIESSITSSSSDQENEFSVEDNDKYWQHLWKENFQMQYQKQYELFIANYKKEHNIDCDQLYFNMLNEPIGDSVVLQQNDVTFQQESIHSKEISETNISENRRDESTDAIQIDQTTSSKVNSAGNKNTRKNNAAYSKSNKAKTQRLIMDSVGMLMRNLTIKTEENESIDIVEEENPNEGQQQTHAQISITENKTVASNYNFNNNQQKSFDEGDELHEEVQQRYIS